MQHKKLDFLGVSAFCESMGMMLRSGIQPDEAIALLQSGEHRSGGELEQALSVLQKEIENGVSFADAMEATGVFPDYALQMIRAGEEAGRVDDILFQLSSYYADQKAIADKLRGAVLYPITMLGLIIVVLGVMLAMVLPEFTGVYNHLTGSLASSVYRYVNWAYGLCWAALILMILLLGVMAAGLLLWNRGGQSTVKRFLNRIPICREILETMGMFRFTGALSTFLASGEMQDEAVLNSLPMTDCPAVEEKLKKCIRSMEEGHSIAQAAYEQELFEPVYGRMLLAGERSGDLDTVLRRLTGLLEEKCRSLLDKLVGFVDPLLSGVLMLTVGMTLLSVMLPLIGMMNAVG